MNSGTPLSRASLVIVSLGLLACGGSEPGLGSVPSSGGAATGGSGSIAGSANGGTPSRGGAEGGGNGSQAGTTAGGAGPTPDMLGIQPLFDATTPREHEVHYETEDAVVTRFGDRGRDRHAREEQFQSYDHYLPHYWEHRTARFIFTDTVAKGGSSIQVSWVTEWKLDTLPEFRAWYSGQGSVAQYYGNYAPLFKTEGPGLYDTEHVRVGDGEQYKYTYTIGTAIDIDGKEHPLALGQFMEIEVSQFLDTPPEGRDNYYGTTFLYEVGKGGMVPWYTVGDFSDAASERENSHEIPEKGWLGGRTTLPYQYSDEPDNHFLQMATNLSDSNAQPFVLGRRVHHTDMRDGHHDESDENPVFMELSGIAGPNYVNASCDGCHHRNGRAPVAALFEPLDKWVFKIASADGSPDPLLGSVLQPQGVGSAGEGNVWIAAWVDTGGLRTPQYAFAGSPPASFSARIAPQLVGLGLLEALEEATVLELSDPNDANDDGISGKPQILPDPVSGKTRLGRFGWKAGASSLLHQVAGALNTDMGVTTSVLPRPDCGALQKDCGKEGAELSDEHLGQLVKYVSLLGVRAQRKLEDSEVVKGEALFRDVGCASCHVPELTTGKNHPFAELRDQSIHPYTDLLLHDMGPGLADSLGEREASGAEWRTTPLWGIGLSACVTGGVEGPFQKQVCAPHHSYLHDGRARSLTEAILWHGGEGLASKEAFSALSGADQAALLAFLESL